MEFVTNSNENKNNNKEPLSLMDSSALPLAPSSFQVWKKPYFMNYGDSGANPPLPSDHLPKVNDDDNKTTSNQNPSPPSDDHNMMISSGDTAGVDAQSTRKVEQDMDPKRLRRIASNRVSAQNSRMKKLQYVSDLEEKAKSLETQIAVLIPQVSHYKSKQESLQMEQNSLKQRMATYNNNTILVNAEIEEKKAQVARLRQLNLYLSQQQQKMQQQSMSLAVWESGLEEMLNSSLCMTPGPGQMVYANPNQLGNQYIGGSIGEILRQNQHKMKQVSVQCVDEHHNAADTSMQMMPSGWGTGAPGLMPNPSFSFQSKAAAKRKYGWQTADAQLE